MTEIESSSGERARRGQRDPYPGNVRLERTPERRVLRMALGGVVGFAGGGLLLLSIVVARARLQLSYLESVEDLRHWQSTPLLVTPLVGMMFGFAGRGPLVASVVGSAAGAAGGAVVGSILGGLFSDAPEWPWAGGIIGAGCGMTLCGLFFGILAWTRQDVEAAHQRAELASR